MSVRGTRRGLFCLALAGLWLVALCRPAEAVVPVLVGPLQALLAILPGLLVALGGFILALFRPSGVKKLVRFLWHQKVFTLVLIAVTAGVVFLARHGWGSSPAATTARAGTDWPAFRGGPSRCGAIPDAPDPTLAEPVWRFTNDVKTVFASPAVVGNRLYISTADKGVFSDTGVILCLDAGTGGEVWRYAPSDFRATFSSPAVKDGYLVCGEGLHYTTDSRITCLDLSGKLVWELRTKSHVESSPCIFNGRVYVGAGDDGYYCIDLKPGPDGKPHVVWHLDGQKYKDCETAHLAADGAVFLGLGMAGNAVVALDAETGSELWRHDTPYPVFGPPALADGHLYVAMGNGDYVNAAEQVRDNVLKKMRDAGKPPDEIAAAEKRLGPAGEIWCLESKKGAIVWKFPVPQTVLGAIAVGGMRDTRRGDTPPTSGEKLYFGSRDGRLYCISTAGKLIKSWDAHSRILTSPAVGAEHVYFGTAAGRLHCLRADTLEPEWEAGLGEGTNFLSSPTLALGHIYIGTDGGGLLCIGRAGEKLAPLWTNMERGGADRSALPERGALAWRFPKGESEAKFVVTAPIVPWGDCLAVPCTLDGKPTLLKLKLGRGLEDEQRVVQEHPLHDPTHIAPATLGDTVLALDFRLRCYYDGGKWWDAFVRPPCSGAFTLDRRHAYYWIDVGELGCVSPEDAARQIRKHPIGPTVTTWTWVSVASVWSTTEVGPGDLPPAPGEGILTVATNTELLALDDSTGTVLWRVPLEGKPLFGPVRLPRSIVLATPKGIAVHRIVNGSLAWKADVGPLAAPLNADADRIAAITKSGDLVVLASSDGKQLAKISGVEGRVPPLLVGDKVLFVNKDLMVLREGEELPALWARTSWLGTVTTPLVLFDGCVYFATETKGVVCIGPGRQ